MKNQKQKSYQSGFAHVSLIIIIVLSIAVIGLAGHRVNQAMNANQKAAETDKAKPGLEDEDAKPKDTVEEIPEEETEEEASTEKAGSSSPTSQPSSQTSTTAKPRTVNFVKGGHNVDSEYVQITHVMEEALSGTCKYTFSLNGTVRVEKTEQITNSKSCSIKIAKSEFPKSAVYSEVTRFTSNDGLVTAETAPLDIEVI